jgi:pyridoxal phosphate-dependent aminotransferase EpsN
MPESRHGRGTRWLTALTIDPVLAGVDTAVVQRRLGEERIESRPVWKPMHQQPALRHYPVFSTGVADSLYRDGLCLPSGSSLTERDLERVVGLVRTLWTTAEIAS